MDIQKEKRNYLAMLVAEEAITLSQSNSLGLYHGGNCFHSESISSSRIDCINWGWQGWLKAKANAVPEGFVLVPVKEIKEWYLDDSESIYREDPDWLCDISIGEVVEVEHRVSYELDQDPVFAAIQWDEENDDVGYYETFKTKAEAEKVAAHCKAMVEAQEPAND